MPFMRNQNAFLYLLPVLVVGESSLSKQLRGAVHNILQCLGKQRFLKRRIDVQGSRKALLKYHVSRSVSE